MRGNERPRGLMIVSDFLKQQSGIRHGFFTREGGVSGGIYASLNCGYGSDDASESVRENRARVAAKLGTSRAELVTARQVHSSRVIVADAPWGPDTAPEADAIVTRTPSLAVGVLTADCTPILFADRQASVVAAAHAGWKGARAGIIEAVIDAMEGLGARRDRICAAIGPTISAAAYEVGPEFEAVFLADAAANSKYFSRTTPEARARFDLPGYCRDRAVAARIASVEGVDLCTYANESLFYSYRRSVHRAEPDYGRQISAIVIL
jgi:YfiH family protein